MLHYHSMVRNKFGKRNQAVRRFCQKFAYKFHKDTEYSRHQDMIKVFLTWHNLATLQNMKYHFLPYFSGSFE